MDAVKVRAIVLVVASLALSGSVFFLPMPDGQLIDPLAVRLYLGLPLACGLLCFVAVWLFVKGMGSFKANLRWAYITLCAALVCLVIALMQLPVVGSITTSLAWYNSGMANIPYLAVAVLLFASMRMFARLLQIQDRFTSVGFVLVVALVVVAGLTLFVPVRLSKVVPDAWGFRVTVAAVGVGVTLVSLAVFNIYRISRVIGSAYSGAMKWLLVAFAAHLVSELQILVLESVAFDNAYGLTGWYNLWYVVEGLLFVRAGYAFWQIGAKVAEVKKASALDIVMWTAGLVTNPRAVDPILERVRRISSRLASGGSLGREDQVVLADVYLDLERYLVKDEPIRTFTREQLRMRLNQSFPHDGEANQAFWGSLR